MAEYIERNEVLDDVRNTMFTMSMCLKKDELDGMRMAQQIIAKKIETFPAADVVPVRHGNKVTHNRPIAGHWVSGELDGGWDGMEGRVWVPPLENNPVDYCSECGKRLDDTFQRYCPNCGANMKDGDGMRLTYKAQDQHGKETGTVWYASTDGDSIFPKSAKEEQVLKKLAAYEDTGLEPDEIKEKVGFMSPVCVGCDGKTADGKRTEKCTYDEDFRKCLERSVHLSELAHAEEQGLLVRLPCKVGDTLYAPTRNIVSEFRVSQFDFGGYAESYLWVNWYLTKGITGNFRIDGIRASEIGKTVFLTREEAEAAIARNE